MWTPTRAKTRKSQDRPVALGLKQPMQCITLVRHRHCHEKIGLRKNIKVTPARVQMRKSQDRPVALGLEQPMQCITLVRHRHCHEKIGLRKKEKGKPNHRERSKLRKFKTKI